VNSARYIPADRSRANVWLVYLLLLALAACFASSMVVYLLLERIIFELLPLAQALKIAILLTAIVWHARTLWRRLPKTLLPGLSVLGRWPAGWQGG